MTSTAKHYLKSFLTFTITFGLLMSLWDFLIDGKVDWLRQVITCVFFGSFMSWFTVRAQKQAIRKFKNTELTDEDFNVCRFVSIDNKMSINKIYELLKNNDLTSNWKFRIEDSTIIGKTRKTKGLWGEKIKIETYNGKITIESRPLLITTLFDNGKNLDNVIMIKEIIERE